VAKSHPVSSSGPWLAVAILAAIASASGARVHGAMQGVPAETVESATVFPEIGQYKRRAAESGRTKPAVARFAAR
jgi:hypothetical protein